MIVHKQKNYTSPESFEISVLEETTIMSAGATLDQIHDDTDTIEWYS